MNDEIRGDEYENDKIRNLQNANAIHISIGQPAR